MPTQSHALRLMLEAIRAMRETGYTREDVQVDWSPTPSNYIEANGHQPYAFGHCTNCHRLIIGWSAYHWSIAVSDPCPRCGKPW